MANAKNSWCLFPSQMTADTLLHELMCFYIVCMNTKVTRCLFVLDVLLKYKKNKNIYSFSRISLLKAQTQHLLSS